MRSHLHQYPPAQLGLHQRFCHPACSVGGRAVHLGVVLSRESSAPVGPPTTVRVHNDFPARHSCITLREITKIYIHTAHKQARSSLHYLFLNFETMKLDLNPIIFELCTKSHCQHPHAAWHQRKQYSGTSNVLGSLPAALQSQSVRWAAGDRWCPRPGSVKAPRLWWPFPSAPSSAPPHTRYHRAARRSPQCALFWGSQRHFPGRNELLPTERWTLC